MNNDNFAKSRVWKGRAALRKEENSKTTIEIDEETLTDESKPETTQIKAENQEEQLALALAAPYRMSVYKESAASLFATEKMQVLGRSNEKDQRNFIKILKKDFDIIDRHSMNQVILGMQQNYNHYTECFMERHLATKKQAQIIGEMESKYHLGKSGGEAFRIGSIAFVITASCEASYITKKEAMKQINIIAAEAKHIYPDWTSYGMGFVAGKALDNPKNKYRVDRHVETNIEALLMDKQSPWQQMEWTFDGHVSERATDLKGTMAEIAALLSNDSVDMREKIALCIKDPNAYFKKYQKDYRKYGVHSMHDISIEEAMWLGMIDELTRLGISHPINKKADFDDLLKQMDDTFAYYQVDSIPSSEEMTEAERTRKMPKALLQLASCLPQEFGLGFIDLHTNDYQVLLLAKSNLVKAVDLAEKVQLSIFYISLEDDQWQIIGL